MSKLQLAKHAANLVAAGICSRITRDVLTRTTQLDPDGLPIEVISDSVGYYAAGQIRDQTDNAVEVAAAWLQQRKAKKHQ